MTPIRVVETPPSWSQPGSPAYRAGACNIGPAEIRRRRDAGSAGVVATVAVAVVLVAVGAPAWARLLIFFPAAGAAVGLLQARYRFCAAFAVRGIRNFGPLGGAERVADAADHRADLRTAARIVGLGALAGAVAAVVLAVLPI